MTRPRAGGGEEEREPSRAKVGGKKRERGGTRCCFFFFFFLKRFRDGKLWHINRSWTTTTARPAGQTEREVKSRRAHSPPPEKSFSLEFVVTPAIATPVEEIICASRRVITEAECEIAVTKLCLWPHDQPETSTLLLTHYFIPPLLPLCSSSLLLFSSHPLLWFHCIFIFFIIRHQVRLIIQFVRRFHFICVWHNFVQQSCLTVSPYEKSEIFLFTCEIHCLKCVDSPLKIVNDMWNWLFYMWILLLYTLSHVK